MFVRRARTRSGPDGTACHAFRLVRSECDGARVRQRTLLNLGRHSDIPKERWCLLCRRVEEILAAQDSLLRCPEDVEREAGRLAERLLELAGVEGQHEAHHSGAYGLVDEHCSHGQAARQKGGGPQRSARGARLRKSHQITIAKPPRIAPVKEA